MAQGGAMNEVGLGTATSWRTMMRTYAQLTTSFVVFCNRVGVEESITFWGGSEVIAPSGEARFSAPLHDEGLYTVDLATADIRRERIALPLLRDERPELNVRELKEYVGQIARLMLRLSHVPPQEWPDNPVTAAEVEARSLREIGTHSPVFHG